ncbi:MAG: SMI1/KNR4 family protein [Lachnospiraceae bacterium]|nr:SMI1/KNR4 family protein [Lachnospiraceae bacterium]
MDIDERINRIMNKMKNLSSIQPEFRCGEFPPKWDNPLEEQMIERYEKANGITLPEDYRRFITTVAGSGTQPFYGLYSPVGESTQYAPKADIKEKFPYTVRTPLNVAELSDKEYDAIFETEELNIDAGYVLLCHEGCGMYSILIVNTDDEDTYGTVWFYDLANDAGIYPLIHQGTNRAMRFLDWLEYYADRTLELGNTGYFSYGELAGRIE